MFDLGLTELLLIGIVALIVVGPKDLPMLFRKVGQFVGKARGKTAQQVDAVAQGRVWPGSNARDNGLVDELGGLDAALAYAAKLGKVGNGKWHAAYIEDVPDTFSTLVEGLSSGSGEQATGYDFMGLVAARQQHQARQQRQHGRKPLVETAAFRSTVPRVPSCDACTTTQ